MDSADDSRSSAPISTLLARQLLNVLYVPSKQSENAVLEVLLVDGDPDRAANVGEALEHIMFNILKS